MRNLYLLILFLLPMLALGQESFILSGKVIDDKGSPIPGATVTIVGVNRSNQTGQDGSFQLVSPTPRVVIKTTFIGYSTIEQSVSLPLREPLLITLNVDIRLLNEVIVSTGYQEVPKERLTGAYEKIGPDLINRSVSPNILNRIEALSPSVYFDNRRFNINTATTSNSLLVRGLSTLNANPDPLIILDNFPYEGDINNLNPNDIESITILKDASSASIWGARAGNGVIVLTSKKGTLNGPLSVSFNTNYNSSEKPRLEEFPQLSSSDFIDMERFLFSKGFYNSQENNVRKPALTPVVELLILNRDGKLGDSQLEDELNILRTLDVRNDFKNYVYRAAANQQYALTVSGGSSNHSYLLSAGYDKSLQSLVVNSRNRLTLRAENKLSLNKKLDVFGRITYAGSTLESANTFNTLGFGQIRPVNKNLYPYASLIDGSGNPAVIDKDFRGSYINTAANGLLLDWQYRPLDEIGLADNRTLANELLLNAGINYKFAHWLNLDVKYQYQAVRESDNEFNSVDSYYTRNLINRYTQINGTQVTRPLPIGGILDQGASSLKSNSGRAQLNFINSWKEKHAVSGLIGGELRDNHRLANSYRLYGYDNDILTLANIDYVSTFPIYNNLASSSSIPAQASQNELTDRFVSLYTNLGYTYDNRLTISISARKDASNLFGVNINQRGIPLGSAGLAWNIANEQFYKLKFLPVLKFRSSLGYSGNTNNSLSAYTTIRYQDASGSINNLRSAFLLNAPDENLRWERVRTLNAGIDFGTAGDRMSGSIDVFQKKTNDLFGIEPIDPTTGFTTANINGASTAGKGLELILNSKILTGKIGWNSTFFMGYMKTKVSRYLDPPTRASNIVGSGLNIEPVEGYPVYPVFSYRFAKLDGTNGDPIGYLDGKESKNYSGIASASSFSDLVFHGSGIPLYNGSFRNSLSWRNFNLSANINFSLNYYFRKPTINYSSLVNSNAGHPDYSLRWQKAGDEANTTVPSFVYPVVTARDAFYNASEVTVARGDHIRLKDVRISYNLQKQTFPRLPFKSAEVFLYSSNLGLIWAANQQKLDPDAVLNGIPPSKSIAAGVRINL